MIVGFAPGGGVDVLARVVAQELNDSAGFQVVIENRPGAGSNIAAKAVATRRARRRDAAVHRQQLRHQPDHLSQSRLRHRRPPPGGDRRARQPGACGQRRPIRRERSPSSCAAAKDKPPSFGFGGSSSRIIAEYVLKVMAKTEATAVPFQSGAPALNALLGNHVDIIAAPLAELVPQVRRARCACSR